MSEPDKRFDFAKDALDARWSSERESVVGQRLARRIRQRERARRVTIAAVMVVALSALGALTLTSRAQKPALQFADGSIATALVPDTELVARVDRSDETTVELSKGAARFEVTHRPGQHFRVEAAQVIVEVIGTKFNVERSGDQVLVSVEQGHVHVRTPWTEADLLAGDVRTFSPPLPASGAEAAADPGAAGDWRALARQGDFEHAYERMEAVRDAPAELLLASDVARLSGHPKQAADHLNRLLAQHAKDPRAPLAAFTLGRVLLDELGRPRQAAEAFARLRTVEGAGPLAEDALAREVEAWSRAGELDKARAAAQAYVASYPNGQRLRSVRRYGGLE
jgi:transmembrane sensor